MTVASPCTGACRVVGGHCGACRRTLEEIATWLSLTDAQRERIMAALPERCLAPQVPGLHGDEAAPTA